MIVIPQVLDAEMLRDSLTGLPNRLAFSEAIERITGSADPDCLGRLPDGALVDGPRGLGVYGLVMTAFGRQYADGFEASAGAAPLGCPEDPGAPGAVHVDGEEGELRRVRSAARKHDPSVAEHRGIRVDPARALRLSRCGSPPLAIGDRAT